MDDFFATLNPWWPPGREDLHWHLLPEPARLATEVTGPYRELTHRPGLAPVEPRWGHITVQDIAPAADVTPDELDRIVAQVRQACGELTPPELTLGPPELGRLGVGCPVSPVAAARPLWEITVAASREVTGARLPPPPPPRAPPPLSPAPIPGLRRSPQPRRPAEPLAGHAPHGHDDVHRHPADPGGPVPRRRPRHHLAPPGHRPSHRPRLTGNDAAQFWLCGWLGPASR